MTLLYYDPIFLEHRTGTHPERPERLTAIMRQLERTGLDRRCSRPTWTSISAERLGRVHPDSYVLQLGDSIGAGVVRIEADTVCSSRSLEVACYAAGAVCDAVERVVEGEDRQALCLVRPPGHHALVNAPMGFCILANVALGAKVAIEELGLDRVMIVDWDVHHGNGTQDIFWKEPRVGFFSIHRWPFYPGTGDADETGSGAGLGATLNVPVEFGTSRQDYLDRFQAALEKMADRIRPQLVLVSAGFDSHRNDPVGSLGLEREDFEPLTRSVLEISKAHAGGRLISVLEGGYDTSALAGCVEMHLHTLLEEKL